MGRKNIESRQVLRGVARIFQRGRHTVSNIIVMVFSPRNIVGCLLKKGFQRGGHRHPRTPLATPLGTDSCILVLVPGCHLLTLSLPRYECEFSLMTSIHFF